jgi:hypothetical protein
MRAGSAITSATHGPWRLEHDVLDARRGLAGKHVLIEKRSVLRLQELDELLALARRAPSLPPSPKTAKTTRSSERHQVRGQAPARGGSLLCSRR